MEQKINKLTQFKQWILSIVSNRSLSEVNINKSKKQILKDRIEHLEFMVNKHNTELYYAETAEIGKNKNYKPKELLKGRIDRIEREVNSLYKKSR